MKNLFKLIGIIAIVAVIGFSMIACNKSGGSSGSKSSGGVGKTLNSAEELKEYLDKQPVNGPDKPIKVSMTINNPMLKSVVDVLNSAGKYVSLNISGNALTTIPREAFYDRKTHKGCETLVSITIPNSVTEIGRDAFIDCSSLTNINIPNNITEIWERTFARTKITSITIPNSVTYIGTAAFSGCTSLTSINIPNSVTGIEDYAFQYCTSLTSVTFQGTISSDYFWSDNTFDGDLREKYLAEGIGTYTRQNGESYTWTKK